MPLVNNRETVIISQIDTCAFKPGRQLSSAASGMSLGLSFVTQFLWHVTNVLEKWQLVVLPQTGGKKFDPGWVPDNLSVSFWFIRVSLCDSIKM